VPRVLGLTVGSWMITLVLSNVWLEGDMHVTHKACAKRVIIERYTYHYSTDEEGNDDSYYSWDYHRHVDKVALGTELPSIMRGSAHYHPRFSGGQGSCRAAR
jgi:hypothetical protein